MQSNHHPPGVHPGDEAAVTFRRGDKREGWKAPRAKRITLEEADAIRSAARQAGNDPELLAEIALRHDLSLVTIRRLRDLGRKA